MKVINFFGGPGCGKSTAASGLFYNMKKEWANAELVTEYAKDLVWSGSQHLLAEQVLVFAQQSHRLNRLKNKVDFAITDSPLLLSAFYIPKKYPESFKQLCFDFYNSYENINYFITRTHEYSSVGRLQNEEEADLISAQMKEFLNVNNIPYTEILAGDDIPQIIMQELLGKSASPLV